MKTVGILGGGQLGRMLAEALLPYGPTISFLNPGDTCPCAVFSGLRVGDITNADAVFAWGKGFDVVTYEWERVSVAGLKRLQAAGVTVLPDPSVLEVIQDKGIQKAFYAEAGLPVPAGVLWDGKGAVPDVDFPLVQKTRTGGYDGKGVQFVNNAADLWPVPSSLEAPVDIKKELAVTVARTTAGETGVYDVVEMVFDPQENLVTQLVAPAEISPEIAKKAQAMAVQIAEKMNVVGVISVEFFLTNTGALLINEAAPRPHNSAHHTIEACPMSQFDALARVILGLPLRSTNMRKSAGMGNILGGKKAGKAIWKGLEKVSAMPGTYVHVYGKDTSKPARKMGHVTCIGPNIKTVKMRLDAAQAALTVDGA